MLEEKAKPPQSAQLNQTKKHCLNKVFRPQQTTKIQSWPQDYKAQERDFECP